jgi:hypothetical protein
VAQGRPYFSVSLWVSPASDDDTVGPGSCKCLEQGLRVFTDLTKNQRRHSGELAAQSGRKLPEAQGNGRRTDVGTDDDDGELPRLHQPDSARAK